MKPNPYLHVDPDRIYDPLTDRVLTPNDPAYAEVRGFLTGAGGLSRLLEEGWAVADGDDSSHRSHLKIVSLETMTTCNQKCYFCPVSIAPRDDVAMPPALFTRIVEELTAYRDTLSGVFLQSYNEPSIDRQFVEHCSALFRAVLPVAVLSNASGLTPAKVDALMEAGRLRYLCINLSTLDRERYKHDRGEDHLAIVLRNLDYLKNRPLAEQMNVVVLGTGDDVHHRDFEDIRRYFAGSLFDVQFHTVMDRAGWLDVGLHPAQKHKRLAGCDNLGSRPLQHLHITPAGKCVLCCEDYDEKYIVGDLTTNTIAEVLQSDDYARMRRWVYGLEEAPDDFICRSCIFARTAAAEKAAAPRA